MKPRLFEITILAAIFIPTMGRVNAKPLSIPVYTNTKKLVLPNNNPSKDLLNDIQAIQQARIQKAHDEQVAREEAARAAQEQAQAAAEAALQAQQQQAVAQAPVAPVQPPQLVQSADYYVNWIIQHESGGNPYAVNTSSGACGLFQRLPCTVTLGDTAGQMADGLAYINSRYGSPYNAYLYWVAHGNY